MSDALRIAHGAFGRVALLDMDRSLVRHAHPHCHVLIKVDGDDTQFLVGDHVAPLTDDLAVLVNAWETHAYIHDPRRENALILALYIEPDWLRSFRPNWAASGTPGFFEHSAGEVTAHIRQTALDLAAEMVHEPGATRRQEELLSELMIAVIERFTPWRSIGASLARDRALERGRFPGAPRHRADAREPGRRAQHRDARQRGGPVAGAFLPDVRSLHRRDAACLPQRARVELAVGAIVDGDESFSAIGDRLGFRAPAHFTRFFRDHCSVAPSEFRSVARLGALSLGR